ncbi:MAG: hypothetical protein U0822_27620 [Anaerolineae bacterium]
MRRVLVIAVLALVLATGLALRVGVNNSIAALDNDAALAASSAALTSGCYKVPLTVSFPALYAASNPAINLPKLRVMDNSNGAIVYNSLIAAGAKSVTIANVQTGRSYNIQIAFDAPPLQPFSKFYWSNGWNGTLSGQQLEAYLPSMNQNVTVSCQSGGAAGVPALPVTITLKPPTGVVAGYLGVWADGTAPSYTVSNSGALGQHYVWAGLATAPAAGVTIELWRSPTAGNQSGTLVARTVTNTEGYFLFSKVDPSLAYELKFTRNNVTQVITPVVATYSGQLYQINATRGAIFVPGAAFLPGQ